MMNIEEDKKIEEDLILLGYALVPPPSSAPQLIFLLDKLQNCLERVDQSPSNSIRTALNPVLNELVAKDFLYHSDVDVKVSVASCINQILRITAPHAPYGDGQIKEILQLIAAAFENICDTSSPSYSKRVSILETVANFGSWNLLVDHQCYSSILEMFKHFLTNIREDHPSEVFSYMGLIMILILEKLEEIQPEILSLLGNVRKENQNVLPIARKLGEGVIESCNSKLMPYIRQAEQCTSFSLRHDRSKLQDLPAVDEDREKTNKERVFEDQNGETGENGEEKVLEEEDIILKGEVVKETRKELQKLVVDMDNEENSRQQVSKEENREKGQKGEEKSSEKERIITENEVVKEKSRKRAKTDQELVVDKDREESSQEQISEEENIEEGEKGEEEVLKGEEEYEDEGMISEGEVVKEMSKGRAKKNQNGPKKTGSRGRQVIKTRCSQHQMHGFLSKLEGTKRSIIQNSIFSAFLDISKRPIRPSWAHALIERYDAEKDAFILAGQTLKFCIKEVEKCIGLSFEGKRVNFEKGYTSPQLIKKYFEMVNGNSRSTDSSEGGYKKRKAEKMNSFAIKSNMLLQKLKQMDVDEKSEADNFLRLSILYMFNTYFFSSNNVYVNHWPLEYLENLEELGSYAWGRAAYEYLRMSIAKASRQLAAMKEIHTYLNGCIPLLETLAYERIKNLHVQVCKKTLRPLVLNYKKGEGRSLDKIRNVLANLQPDKIKECEDCRVIQEEELPSSEDPR